jgi:hypothetical protein
MEFIKNWALFVFIYVAILFSVDRSTANEFLEYVFVYE